LLLGQSIQSLFSSRADFLVRSNDPLSSQLVLGVDTTEMLGRCKGLFILLAVVGLIDAIPTVLLDGPGVKCFEVEAPIDTILRVSYNAPGTAGKEDAAVKKATI
jgi:hypothetical protein